MVAIQQTLIDDRPTVSAVWRGLESQGLPLKTKEGATVDFQPWSRADPTQVGLVLSSLCGAHCGFNVSRNETNEYNLCGRPSLTWQATESQSCKE